MSEYIEWSALGQVVLFGLIVGAGLPALFAVGVRALAGTGARDEDGHVRGSRAAVAIACFAVIIAAIVGAIVYIAAGGH
ncbi:hypothetical protein [Demequina zhanjiangensis]|uniref:Interferon-induced transmembrane protein n=1 Tax=Demequina zhanjiangensis TaxID=3051659 RepID=A0ABT8FZL6_9MICO|nr:hypothetical protein [Demequina sp. SYSU T00b26]MDN4472336.1 hypothetical protein [Demequina sp. SYSU T00b26]